MLCASAFFIIFLLLPTGTSLSVGFDQVNGFKTTATVSNYVTLNTTTNVYSPKQTVSLYGRVSPFTKGVKVKLAIISPTSKEYLANLTTIQNKSVGSWSYGFHLPSNAPKGNWFVMASYSSLMGNTSFLVVSLQILHTEVMKNSTSLSKQVNFTGGFPRLPASNFGNFSLVGFANSTYSGINETLQVYQGTFNGTKVVALGYNQDLSRSVVEILCGT